MKEDNVSTKYNFNTFYRKYHLTRTYLFQTTPLRNQFQTIEVFQPPKVFWQMLSVMYIMTFLAHYQMLQISQMLFLSLAKMPGELLHDLMRKIIPRHLDIRAFPSIEL